MGWGGDPPSGPSVQSKQGGNTFILSGGDGSASLTLERARGAFARGDEPAAVRRSGAAQALALRNDLGGVASPQVRLLRRGVGRRHFPQDEDLGSRAASSCARRVPGSGEGSQHHAVVPDAVFTGSEADGKGFERQRAPTVEGLEKRVIRIVKRTPAMHVEAGSICDQETSAPQARAHFTGCSGGGRMRISPAALHAAMQPLCPSSGSSR